MSVQRQTIIYTPLYAPIEQMIGKAEPRSDLYALAATLYHLATGKLPVNPAAELRRELDDPHGTIPADQRWFFELLKINLSEDVNDRYLSAKEFKADLERRRVTKETTCPHCRATNEVRKPYCGGCGESLNPASSCAQCGRNSSMGSRFCIHCGNRL